MITATAYTAATIDPHVQLRSLYMTLLSDQEHFDEFKQLLSLYGDGVPTGEGGESAEAADVRQRLNTRIREWTGLAMDDLSAMQVLQWRAIIVEERINIAISPWKESNAYLSI